MKPLVIIPTYNEKENIEDIIHEILSIDDRINILVIDDNSPDGTGKIVEGLVKDIDRMDIIHREGKSGLGSAYVRGFKYGLKNGYDRLIEMDADFSHNPKYLKDMLKYAEKYDLVIGSRYVKGVNVINWPMSRLILSYYANVYTRFVTGVPVKDATAGFQCFHRKVLEAIDLDKIESDGYSFQIEMKFKTWCKKFSLYEFPIIFSDREKGQSKMNKSIIWEAIFMVWKLRLKNLFH